MAKSLEPRSPCATVNFEPDSQRVPASVIPVLAHEYCHDVASPDLPVEFGRKMNASIYPARLHHTEKLSCGPQSPKGCDLSHVQQPDVRKYKPHGEPCAEASLNTMKFWDQVNR